MDLLYESIINTIGVYESKMDDYVEAVVKSIDALEDSTIARMAFIDDDIEFMEASFNTKSVNEVFSKVKASIKNIFSTEYSPLTSKNVNRKIEEQLESIKKVDEAFKNLESKGVSVKAVKVQIPDLWKYYEFVSDLMKEHVEKFTAKKTLTLFERKVKEGRAIDVLIKNLEQMSSAIKKTKNTDSRKVNKIAKKIDKEPIGSKFRRAYEVSVGIPVRRMNTHNSTLGYTESVDDESITLEASSLAGAYFGGAVTIGAITSLAILPEYFRTAPVRIAVKAVNLSYVRERLTILAPDKFELYIKHLMLSAASAIDSNSTLEEFAASETGPKDAVIYANKINKLISAYSKFYLSLVDFYIKVCLSSLRMFSI